MPQDHLTKVRAYIIEVYQVKEGISVHIRFLAIMWLNGCKKILDETVAVMIKC